MKSKSLDVSELIARAQSGDSEALGRLLAQCERRLRLRAHGQIRSALAGRCDTGDLLQQSFLEAVRGFKGFRGETEGELVAWLERILQRNLADAVRSHLAVQKRTANDESRVSRHPELASPRSSATKDLARREDESRLQRAIALLPHEQAEAVRLRHLEGSSLQEMAERMGRTSVAVASLVKRGMRRLRQVLDEENLR